VNDRVRKADRFGLILERLASAGSVGVGELALELGVSEATVRRDLRALDEQRLLERAHGGAVSHGTGYELPVRYPRRARAGGEAADRPGRTRACRRRRRRGAHRRHDDDRGRAPARPPGRALGGDERAVNIAGELAVRPNVKLVVTGGVAGSASYELVGPLAEATLRSINVDVAFVGVDGIDVRAGLTTQNETEAAMNRVLIGRSRRVIVVADGSKLGHVAFAGICSLTQAHELITDTGAARDELARLRSAGLTIDTV
jgi:DeoR family transcriptional regulator of aga operon